MSWPLHALLLGASLLVPLVALLTLYQPAAPLPPTPPLQFNGAAAANLTGGSPPPSATAAACAATPAAPAELAAADWVAANLKPFDPSPRRIQFATNLPWQSQPVPMTDVVAYRPGRSRQIVAVIVHRDGGSPSDLAGTGILVELSKVLTKLPRERGLALVSTDGGLTGGQGAAALATLLAAGLADRRGGGDRRGGRARRARRFASSPAPARPAASRRRSTPPPARRCRPGTAARPASPARTTS